MSALQIENLRLTLVEDPNSPIRTDSSRMLLSNSAYKVFRTGYANYIAHTTLCVGKLAAEDPQLEPRIFLCVMFSPENHQPPITPNEMLSKGYLYEIDATSLGANAVNALINTTKRNMQAPIPAISIEDVLNAEKNIAETCEKEEE